MSAGTVIVGAGQAGLQTALSLREGGYEEPITLVGDELLLPYQRPPLSKAFLLGAIEEAGLFFRPQALLEKLRIDFVQGVRAVSIDRAGSTVVLGDGTRVPYDHAVIATGSRPRFLDLQGAQLQHVHYLRTVDDAHGLRSRLAQAQNIVIIGAGFIGLEFAAVARKLGRSVHVVEAGPRILGRIVSLPTAEYVHGRHGEAGIVFSLNSTVCAFEGRDGAVSGVHLGDGRVLEADMVLVGIGALPNSEIAAEAGLAVDNGILVDELLLTSDPQISAIGDCAHHPNTFAGGRVRLESVQNAADQARTVAARLLGRPKPYDAVPWFWSDQSDLKIQIAGIVNGYDHSVLTGSMAEGRFSIFCFREGRFLGVESVNRPNDHMQARRLLAASRALRLEDFEASGFNLKAVLDSAASRAVA